ncbi:MAG: BrnT family toxin, partial [Schwartzia sp.]|nr:BrnT family toxin [Schwartzia sp. (in: firmicutes)]
EEERYKVLGKVGKVILVICTNRGEAVRLISARKATVKEKEVYYGYSGSVGL